MLSGNTINAYFDTWIEFDIVAQPDETCREELKRQHAHPCEPSNCSLQSKQKMLSHIRRLIIPNPGLAGTVLRQLSSQTSPPAPNEQALVEQLRVKFPGQISS